MLTPLNPYPLKMIIITIFMILVLVLKFVSKHSLNFIKKSQINGRMYKL